MMLHKNPLCLAILLSLACWLPKKTCAFKPSHLGSRTRRQAPSTPFVTRPAPSTTLRAADESTPDNNRSSNLPFWLDPGTKGGVVVLSLVAFVVPLLLYQVVVGVLGVDEINAGRWIGLGFTVSATLAWVSTYIFRVATKDMTYAKQLKDYENAVIAKRLEELDEDEIQALVEEVEEDDF